MRKARLGESRPWSFQKLVPGTPPGIPATLLVPCCKRPITSLAPIPQSKHVDAGEVFAVWSRPAVVLADLLQTAAGISISPIAVPGRGSPTPR